MVLWFMRKKYLNDPSLFLNFEITPPPFEEELNVHLNKFEFESCK
jgi:hypothetical protein